MGTLQIICTKLNVLDSSTYDASQNETNQSNILLLKTHTKKKQVAIKSTVLISNDA